jgi:hypothetical protein
LAARTQGLGRYHAYLGGKYFCAMHQKSVVFSKEPYGRASQADRNQKTKTQD